MKTSPTAAGEAPSAVPSLEEVIQKLTSQLGWLEMFRLDELTQEESRKLHRQLSAVRKTLGLALHRMSKENE